MKANDFVREFGLDAAVEFLELTSYNINHILMLKGGLSCEHLQRLIESHELIKSIESIGGLDFAIKFIKSTGSAANGFLEQAIADVESCQ